MIVPWPLRSLELPGALFTYSKVAVALEFAGVTPEIGR